MSNGFLSQEEIDSLLNGGANESEPQEIVEESSEEILPDIEKDLLGEIGNISMGSASTALSTIIGQQVNITTPVVSVTTLRTLKENFESPNIALEVEYVSGIIGANLLVIKVNDAAIIANLMMGGDGRIEPKIDLSEIETSAVSEAMNQMIGSAATSMATMFAREVNISPPTSKIWDEKTGKLTDDIDEDDPIVHVAFKLTIGDLVDSTIMQILPISTAKKIVSIMMGTEESSDNGAVVEEAPQAAPEPQPQYTPQYTPQPEPQQTIQQQMPQQQQYAEPQYAQPQYTQPQYAQPQYAPQPIMEKPIEQPPVNVQQASFQQLGFGGAQAVPQNIDLILDVPLEVSVVLGRAKLNIRDVLDLGTGSLIELDKLAEEPVEILINGKKVAYGEVVVVDENFGVRITSIISNEERIKSLGQ